MEAFKFITNIIESNLLSFIGIIGALALAQNASDARSAVTILLVGIALLVISVTKVLVDLAAAGRRGPRRFISRHSLHRYRRRLVNSDTYHDGHRLSL